VDWVECADVLLADGSLATFRPLAPEAWDHASRASGLEGEIYRRVDALLSVHEQAIRHDTPRHWRRAGGYRLERLMEAPEVARGPGRPWDGTRNLAHLLCGAEGTLGFSTSITVGLTEKPAHSGLAIVHFPSRHAALEAVEGIMTTAPASVELFDRVALRRAQDVAEYAPKLHFVQRNSDGSLPAALLFVEYDGESPLAVQDGMERLQKHLGPLATITHAIEEAAISDVWAVRKVGLGLAMSARLPVQAAAIIEDAAVPVEHLSAYILELEAAMEADDVEAVMYAHASAGCLHVRPFLDLRQRPQVEAMDRIARASAELARKYGGTIASEHGDGRARGALAEMFYSPGLYAAYAATKRAFDARGLLNPHKIVDAKPLTDDLRIGPDYHPRPLAAPIAFPDASGRDVGFVEAVEACNGSAVCRKTDVGTMCPSFMATREERDSTRGRANTLREALTGGFDGLTSPEVAEAMDLCLACKACKSECPAGVDMGKLKSAWLNERWKTERPPARTSLLARLPEVARKTAGPLAPAANRLARTWPARKTRAAMGLDPERDLPPFARHPFKTTEASDPDPTVLLYADTFARTMEPEIARAAVRVLRAAGERVAVAPDVCCGRTDLSEGFLARARAKARALLDALAPEAETGRWIVGLEPSCLLTLRDEVPALLPDDPRAPVVAKQALLFEEWAATRADVLEPLAREHAPEHGREHPPALVHGHCHQKALSGMDAPLTALRAAGFDARGSGAGCCGLAGGFGYEADHVEVSRAVAEDRLAPAVRAASGDTVIVAAGTSCRHQIEHVTGRVAVHPAQALADALGV
ncbi:MAG: FAD-linked oxidase C-terminal domain-containing protein, partial [Bacteroidota bacterium]